MDDDDLNKDDASDNNDIEGGAEEEPLNSEDDVTDEDNADLFETDNVVVCQYDKVRIAKTYKLAGITKSLFLDKSISKQMEILPERRDHEPGRERLRISKVQRRRRMVNEVLWSWLDVSFYGKTKQN